MIVHITYFEEENSEYAAADRTVVNKNKYEMTGKSPVVTFIEKSYNENYQIKLLNIICNSRR